MRKGARTAGLAWRAYSQRKKGLAKVKNYVREGEQGKHDTWGEKKGNSPNVEGKGITG